MRRVHPRDVCAGRGVAFDSIVDSRFGVKRRGPRRVRSRVVACAGAPGGVVSRGGVQCPPRVRDCGVRVRSARRGACAGSIVVFGGLGAVRGRCGAGVSRLWGVRA